MINKNNHELALGQHVAHCIQNYLTKLNGEKPSGIHSLVLDAVEKPLLEVVMAHNGHKQTKAAEMLGINRGTLRKKLHYHGLANGA